MNRYNFYCSHAAGHDVVAEASKGGDYVLYADALAAISAEREACAKACETVHIRPIEGAHKDYMEGKEMAVMQCARMIRLRFTIKEN